MSLPRTGKYTKAQFKAASEWELNLILEVEGHLNPIRNQLKHIMKAHYAIGNSVKASGDKFKAIKMKDRVTPSTVSIKHYKEKMS